MAETRDGEMPVLPKWDGSLTGVLSTNVTIIENSYYEISNDAGGKTVYIGGSSND